MSFSAFAIVQLFRKWFSLTASNYYFLLCLCEALLLLVNASCLSTMTSDVAMSHGNVTPLTLPDCAFGLSL